MEITNARLILPNSIERGSLSIRNGRIQKISKSAGAGAKSKGEYIARQDAGDFSDKNRFFEQIKFLELFEKSETFSIILNLGLRI